MFGDVRDYLAQMPHFANDDPATALAPNGYETRLELCKDARATRVFEFGCQFGHGMITLLEACPLATWAGWIDDERAFPGSNVMATKNLTCYAKLSHRALRIWYGKRSRAASGLRANVVMVDGGHGRHEALCDLNLALAMRPRLIMVDDFGMLSVREALDDFSMYHSLPFEVRADVGAGLAFFRNLED